ncbi:MAG: zinc-binding dehydrogenase [Pacificimonas sp.]
MPTGLRMKSKLNSSGSLDMYLDEVDTGDLKPHEVVVKVEAAPINPSDLGVMFGPADVDQATAGTYEGRPMLSAPVDKSVLSRFKARLDKGLPLGNEGAGTVVEAGSSDEAQALMGRVVATTGGMMYSEYVKVPAQSCLPLNDGNTAKEGASSFVNPMTALSMVETMKMEGHSALVHTAAASNLGQMLNRICQADGVPLVNVVRKPEQAKLLRDAGAKYVVDTSTDNFKEELTDALAETGATLAFDAVGGGKNATHILSAMEAALIRNATEYSVYGVTTHKQVYLYGSLDMGPTVLARNYGMFWGVGGWLLPPFLQKLGGEGTMRLRKRVADELTTTFASNYTSEVTLAEMLDVKTAQAYQRKATGEKYLVLPQG